MSVRRSAPRAVAAVAAPAALTHSERTAVTLRTTPTRLHEVLTAGLSALKISTPKPSTRKVAIASPFAVFDVRKTLPGVKPVFELKPKRGAKANRGAATAMMAEPPAIRPTQGDTNLFLALRQRAYTAEPGLSLSDWPRYLSSLIEVMKAMRGAKAAQYAAYLELWVRQISAAPIGSSMPNGQAGVDDALNQITQMLDGIRDEFGMTDQGTPFNPYHVDMVPDGPYEAPENNGEDEDEDGREIDYAAEPTR